MKVVLHNKDITEVTEADTIVLPVDGSAPGLEGNIARHFMRHVGVEKMHELYAPPPYYPFNGECYWSNIATFGTHLKFICCLGILSHEDGADHKANLRSALRDMFRDADSGSDMGSRLVCPVLTGGKRIDPVSAIHIMVAEADVYTNPSLELHIAETDQERFEILQGIVR